MLTSLGEDLSTFEIEVVLDVIDVNNDGSLSFEEFMKAVFDGTLKKPQQLNDSQANRLKKFFEEADVDKSGTLTIDELGALLKKMDASLSPDQIDAILANADENGDGSLDF